MLMTFHSIADPWTISIWTAWVHLYMDFFLYTVLEILEIFALPYDFLNLFSSLCYYKNTVYNTYNMQNMH